jgi:hypothetical protein
MQPTPPPDCIETAPMLTEPWGMLAPAVAAIIVARPDAGRRLALASRRVFHAAAAFIGASLEEGREPHAIAADIERCHGLELLARAVPNPHHRLFSVLDRLGARAASVDLYRDLNAVLRGPAAAAVLDAGELNRPLIQIFQQIAHDPVLLAGRRAIGISSVALSAFSTALTFLRINGLARDIEALPPGSGWRAIERRIAADLARGRLSQPPFRVPAGWRHVETFGDLWTIGREMRNCVSGLGHGSEHYLRQLVEGQAVMLTAIDPPRGLATVQRVGPTLWCISEAQIPESYATTCERRDSLHKHLAEALARVGHHLLEQEPLAAMSDIHWWAAKSCIEHGADEEIAKPDHPKTQSTEPDPETPRPRPAVVGVPYVRVFRQRIAVHRAARLERERRREGDRRSLD